MSGISVFHVCSVYVYDLIPFPPRRAETQVHSHTVQDARPVQRSQREGTTETSHRWPPIPEAGPQLKEAGKLQPIALYRLYKMGAQAQGPFLCGLWQCRASTPILLLFKGSLPYALLTDLPSWHFVRPPSVQAWCRATPLSAASAGSGRSYVHARSPEQ